MYNETENEGDGAPTLNAEELEAELALPEWAKELDPENAAPEQVKELLKLSNTALAQKNHFRKKWKDATTGSNPARPAPAEVIPNAPHTDEAQAPAITERLMRVELSEEKRQFGHAHNLSPEETDAVFAFAKGNGLSNEDAFKHPFVRSGIEGSRRENRIAAGTPGPSSRVPKVEGKTFREMTPAERRKNWDKIVGGSSRE